MLKRGTAPPLPAFLEEEEEEEEKKRPVLVDVVSRSHQ